MSLYWHKYPWGQLRTTLLCERDAVDDNRLHRTVRGTRSDALYSLHDLHAFLDPAKYRVFRVEEIIRGGIDEKLGAVGVGAGIGHRDGADIVAILRMYLVLKRVAGAAGAPARHCAIIFRQRVAALNHKIFYYAVEFGAVINSRLRELHKIRDRLRRLRIHQLNLNISLAGLQCRMHSWRV